MHDQTGAAIKKEDLGVVLTTYNSGSFKVVFTLKRKHDNEAPALTATDVSDSLKKFYQEKLLYRFHLYYCEGFARVNKHK